MKYPKISADHVSFKDFNNNGLDAFSLDILKNLPFNQGTPKVTAGATGVTVKENVFEIAVLYAI